jgi:hypothetical protein
MLIWTMGICSILLILIVLRSRVELSSPLFFFSRGTPRFITLKGVCGVGKQILDRKVKQL